MQRRNCCNGFDLFGRSPSSPGTAPPLTSTTLVYTTRAHHTGLHHKGAPHGFGPQGCTKLVWTTNGRIMKELKESGAIEIEVKGENAKMDRLWEMAYGKLAAQMFEPSNDPVTLATLQDDPNAFSNFDRADKFNADVRKRIEDEYKAENDNRDFAIGGTAAVGFEVSFTIAPLLDPLPIKRVEGSENR